MPQAAPSNGSVAQRDADAERKLVERVAQRVYELWREDLRRELQRRGRRTGGKA